MECHWSLSESKTPRVTRTLLSIPAELNIAVVIIVSILPPVVFPILRRQFQVRQSQMVSPLLSCSTAFSVLWQGLSTCLFSLICHLVWIVFGIVSLRLLCRNLLSCLHLHIISSYIYIYIYIWSTYDITVITVIYGLSEPSSNPVWGWLRFTSR